MATAAQAQAQPAAAPVRIAAPDSAEEREADWIADAVLRGGAALGGPPGGSGPPVIHRQCAACAAGGPPCEHCSDERDAAVFLSRSGSRTRAGCSAEAVAAVKGPGQPLPEGVRDYFAPRFGADLSHIRLHTGGRAAAAARAINARAYTFGSDIAFAPGAFRPDTQPGRRLIAHELAHVAAGHGNAGALLRDDGPENAESEATEAVEAPLSRAEEIELSRNSPGGVTGTLEPFRLVLDNFAIDSADLKDEHRAALAELTDLLRSAGANGLRLVIVGHADASGADRYNQRLSRRRASAVRRALGGSLPVQVVGLGEASPAVDEDTASARSRNRRVEIFFLPAVRPPTREGDPDPEVRTPDPDPTRDPPPGGDDEDTTRDPPPPEHDDAWFCAEHPVLCAAFGIGVGALAALIYYCINNPAACLPDPPEREGRRRRRACVDSVDLPSGAVPVQYYQYAGHHAGKAPFRMRITFRHDPENGCDCSCGEYLQMVRGTFEKNVGRGWVAMPTPRTADGGNVTAGLYKEDSHQSGPYGHRWTTPLRVLATTGREDDEFLPSQETGCQYAGADEPGITTRANPSPGEQYRYSLHFFGTPVDGCLGRLPIPGHQHFWSASGYFRIPEDDPPEEDPPEEEPPEREPPEPDPPEPAEAERDAPPPEPYRGPTIGPAPPDASRYRIAPSGFCLNDNISCAAADYIQDRRMRLDAAEYDRAVSIEFRALRDRCAIFRPRPNFCDPAAALNWDRWTRGQAAQRVDAFLTYGVGVRDRDYGPICPWR